MLWWWTFSLRLGLLLVHLGFWWLLVSAAQKHDVPLKVFTSKVKVEVNG